MQVVAAGLGHHMDRHALIKQRRLVAGPEVMEAAGEAQLACTVQEACGHVSGQRIAVSVPNARKHNASFRQPHKG